MLDSPGVAVPPNLSERDELLLLRAVFRSSDYGVLFSDNERQDVVCNQRFAELFGLDPEWAVRSAPGDVRAAVLPRLQDPEAFVRLLDDIYSEPSLVREDEIELTVPEGTVLRRFTAPVSDGLGRLIGRLWTFLDVSRTRRLEREVAAQAGALEKALKATSGRLHRTEAVLAQARQQLMEAEKLTAVGLVAASVAHDIRNILTPLTIELKLADSADERLRTEALDSARGQMNRLFLLSHRLLSLARPPLRSDSPVDFGALVYRIVRMMERQATMEGIVTVQRCARDLPRVLGDEAQLEQVVANLVLNALQAMRPGREGTLTVQLFPRGNTVYLRVSDTGPGIPAEIRSSLFEPFTSTRPGGTGLGLYACRRILDEHGGSIRFRSAPGEGASFTVSLPAHLPQESPADGSAGADPEERSALPMLARQQLLNRPGAGF